MGRKQRLLRRISVGVLTCWLASVVAPAAAWAEDVMSSDAPVEAAAAPQEPAVEETTTTTAVPETTTAPFDPNSPDAATILLKLEAGLSAPDQAEAVTRSGGVEVSSVPALRLHVVRVPGADADAALTAYRADAAVTRAELDQDREVAAVPSDPGYDGQWALPKIGWDTAFGAVDPAGTSTLAVLDTGVDASDADLAGRVVDGYSAVEGEASAGRRP